MTGLAQKSNFFLAWHPQIVKQVEKCIAMLAMGNTSNKIFFIIFMQ